MPAARLKKFLDEHEIKYLTIQHSPAFRAQDIAAAADVSGKELAKTVIVWLDGRLVMCVLPASRQVHFDRLEKATGAETVGLATEAEFAERFPGCELGAMPPFGNLYDMEVYVARSLAEDEEIAFNAGSHTELIRLAYRDFEDLVKPKVLDF